jgi:hypothetical protein
MNVEDDVSVHVSMAESWQGRVCLWCAIKF